MKKRAILSLILAGALLLTLSACGGRQAGDETGAASGSGTSAAPVEVDTSDMFTDRDLDGSYDAASAAAITFTGDSASCASDAVQISGGTVTITGAGTYILSGTLNDGTVIVDAAETDKIQLVLDGANITSSDSAAIYVRAADKVFLTTAAGSQNSLANGGTYTAIDENNIDAVVFSKSDLTLNGSGALTIDAAAGHGIVSKDDLVLTGGTYTVNAASHGLSGKDSVRIAGGTYTLTTGKDGVHAENADDSSLGFLYIAGGDFHITAQGDGMSAAAYLLAEDGTYSVQSGGGSANAADHTEDWAFGPGQSSQTSDTDDTSTKGMKAGSDLILHSGTFSIDAADDALHANGNVTVSGGSFELATGDDGIHADSAVTISGGSITITQSYEGIEGLSIDITGGDIVLTASDDGLNAAGGNDSSGFGGPHGDMFAATEGAYITISGGTLHIDASGDGIDSNGDLTVSGGETYVSGPTNSGNGALDYSGEAVISGGIFVAAGASGMAQNFGSASTQGVMMVTVSGGSAGSTISLTDSAGNELVSWQADKSYSSVIVSCPEIEQGAAYTLTAGSSTTQVTMDSLVYGSDGGMGGMMGGGDPGGMNGGRGGRP